MKQIIITSALLLLVGGVTPAGSPPEPIQEAVAVEQAQSEENIIKEPKPVEQAEKPKEEPVNDPQGCEPEQYWAAEAPHNCIDKPVVGNASNTQPTTTYAVGCENYRHLVEQYDWDVETMMYAMQHESGCNPNAVGDQYVIGGIYAPSCGLLQVRTLAGRPSCEELKNPATNIATSYAIWQGQGYRAWSVLH